MFGRGTTTRAMRWPANALAAALSMIVASAALAASPQCLQLEVELARLPDQPGGSFVQSDEFAVAANTQRDQIDLARIRAADLGCGRAIAPDMVAACADLNARIARMEDNLGKLESRPAMRPNRNARAERIRILDALERARCYDQPGEEEDATLSAEPGANEAGVTIIRGGSSESLDADERYPQRIVIGRNQQQGTGEYRTLCVRTCDGYFFPMSNAAELSDFQRDEKNCEASCPGTDIELFYHLNTGQPGESMVSARSGQPYDNLETAYRYKRVDLPRVPACGCNVSLNSNFSVVAGEGRAVPKAAKPAQEDEAPLPVTPRAPPDPDRKVRAVGPAFLPAPPTATDLRVPGPTPAR